MIRLKYSEVDGMLVSREVVGNGNTLVVRLNPASLTYKVTNASGEHEFGNGSASNLIALKKAAKDNLVALGVAFTNEVRQRRSKDETLV